MIQLDMFQKPIQAYRMPTVYHNTTAKQGPELEAAQVKASTQTEMVLKVFRDHPTTDFSVWEVYFHLGQQYSKSGIGRAITVLTDAGELIKAGKRATKPYNENSYCWKLNR